MALCKRSLLGQGRALQNALLAAAAKPTFPQQGLVSSPSEPHERFSARAFSSLLSKWQERRVYRGKCSHNPSFEALSLRDPLAAHRYQLNSEASSAQQVRHVYVEVIDNDLDSAIKVFKRKMNKTVVEEKLKEKRFYTKPAERRKLAKHYKKLNRARRELNDKLATVRHRMEKIQEVRRVEREEKRAKAAAAAAEAKAPKNTG